MQSFVKLFSEKYLRHVYIISELYDNSATTAHK
jgi:hypothetical protein